MVRDAAKIESVFYLGLPAPFGPAFRLSILGKGSLPSDIQRLRTAKELLLATTVVRPKCLASDRPSIARKDILILILKVSESLHEGALLSTSLSSTALSGVRISCDMVARNCDLASLAACTCACRTQSDAPRSVRRRCARNVNAVQVNHVNGTVRFNDE